LHVELHSHALVRIKERGATPDEVVATVNAGERFAAKHGRVGFRRNFSYGSVWRGRTYSTKQVEAVAVFEDDRWLVLTVLVKFF
jgi:hypothetical protein